ncbi:folylpolyglutamate synthase/dihydrofolate synthase family protein [Catenulispora yoronensis]|uniref:tetrahydrofolate synthase n=1 Tax=Catenulispora yoronensis TaxID=450799 RepID=A0ABN2UTE5_9ACTN
MGFERLYGTWLPSSYEEAVEFLYAELTPAGRGQFSGADGFERSKRYLALLGNPQDRVQAVHIAGTAGKGSISYGVSRLLTAHGLTVGCHVSPHVYDIRERLQIDSELCGKEQFRDLLAGCLPAIRQMAGSPSGCPTFFEVTVGMAFLLFAQQGCDVAVVETGLGGLFDTTNTITRRDKLAVISRIGLDHQVVLGDTVELIAQQKAGILGCDRAVAARSADDSVNQVLVQEAARHGCDLAFIPSEPGLGRAPHEAENAGLILAAARITLASRNRELDEAAARTDLAASASRLPGRMEPVHGPGGEVVAVLDGAHNPLKLAALCDSLAAQYGPEARFPWIFACRADKAMSEMIGIIAEHASAIMFGQFAVLGGDVPVGRSATAEQLLDAARTAGAADLCQGLDVPRLVGLGRASGSPVVVAGSFYYLADMRRAIENAVR